MRKKRIVDLETFDPFSIQWGLTFTKCEDGYSHCFLKVKENLLNRHKTLHGGVTFMVADTAMGAALYTWLYEDELCSTVDNKIVYMKPVKSGTITCESRVINRGKRLAMVEAEIKQGEKLIAKTIGTLSIYNINKE